MMMQQQDYSLAALAERDANDPFAKPAPALPPATVADEDEDDDMMAASFAAALHQKALAEGLYAG